MKAKIYHVALKTMLKYKCASLKCSQLNINNILDIALEKIYKDDIEIWCTNSFKQCCYPICAGFMVDYKKPVLIIRIKANMQRFIYHILPKKDK